MQASDTANTLSEQVLTELKSINQRLDRLEADVEKLDYKFETYQKALDQVVRVTTTIVIAARFSGDFVTCSASLGSGAQCCFIQPECGS